MPLFQHRLFLDTIMYGPLTEEQVSLISKYGPTRQDLDMVLNTLSSPAKEDTCLRADVIETEKLIYEDNTLSVKFIKSSNFVHAQKNRLLCNIPTLRIFGKDIYIPLDVVIKGDCSGNTYITML